MSLAQFGFFVQLRSGALAAAKRLILSALLIVLCVATAVSVPASAAEIAAAVAANFTAPAKEIADAFKMKTGYAVDLSFGSTGKLYTQITQGAPFDIFLAADATRPKMAETEGWAVSGTGFTYAVGKLVLWSADPALVDSDGAILAKGPFTHIAIANPAAAPYGAAAVETMTALGVYKNLEPKIVTGENIAQTQQFVVSGNAELGFIALSQVVEDRKGSRWIVPDRLYSPILQDAVLLKQGEQNSFAKAFLAFLRSSEALKITARYGYGVPSGM